ncbi:MAG: OmpH family outer membrane protein [Rikenellaceae bacterium]
MKLKNLILISAIISSSFAFVSCNNAATSASNESQAVSVDSSATKYSGEIAYVRMDSLMSSYGLYIDKSAEFTKKQEKAQKELESKMRSLEAQVNDFQEKAQKGLITTYQARTKQEELQKKEQQIYTYRDQVLAELSGEEAVISAEISEAIMSYLKEYNQAKRYSMILQSMAGNPVILADPALDITAEVLSGLNARYESSLK